MDVRCDKCQARYRIDDARVGPNGLTMRCGKCGNTFKVSKDSAASANVSKPAPAAAPEEVPGSTMMFKAPSAAPKTAPAAPAKPSAPPAVPEEVPGSTMMFKAPSVAPKSAPAPAPAAPAAPAKPLAVPEEVPGSTMMFKAPNVAAKSAPATAPGAKISDPGSTMMFGSAKVAPIKLPPAPETSESPDQIPTAASTPRVPPAAPPAPAARAAPAIPEEESVTSNGEEAPADEPTQSDEPEQPAAPQEAPQEEPAQEESAQQEETAQEETASSVGDEGVDEHAMTGEAPAPGADDLPHPPARKQPMSQGAKLGIAGISAVVALGLVGGVYKLKFAAQPPPAAAIEALNESRKLLDKDSLSLFAQALETEEAARASAPRSEFGEAHALHAQIELAWSDALSDQSLLLADKASKLDDEKKKTEADAAAKKAESESAIHRKAALAAASLGTKSAPLSAEIHLALADYYRAGKSQTNYDREMKKAIAGKLDEGELAAVDGAWLLIQEDGEKALAKLKTALAADPQNARIQYRIAQAQALLKNDAEEKKALEATLKISPTHERAKLLLESLKAAEAPAQGGQ